MLVLQETSSMLLLFHPYEGFLPIEIQEGLKKIMSFLNEIGKTILKFTVTIQ